MKEETTNLPKAVGAPHPSQGKAPGLTIADVHYDAVMLAGLIQGAEVLSWENRSGQHKHAGNALTALFPEIQRKADELVADLDRLDTGCRVGPANGGVENHANAITAQLGIRRNEIPVEESRLSGEAHTAAAALSWMCIELGAIAGGDPFDPGMRDTLIALISHNQDKVTALVEYTEALERAHRTGRGLTQASA